MSAFALTIFTGAFLLFQVQPLIGKYILPWFGGGPGVWTTCMLFFQVLLLGGYAYAHLLTRWFKPRTQVIAHLALLLVALAMLPITPSESWKPHGPGHPVLLILGLLTVSLGLPYFVLSSTGPLMQQWFSQTDPGRSPYRLYALSNAASFLALVSYPFFFETHLTRTAQARGWGWGLAVFAVCCGFCGFKLLKSRGQASAENPAQPAALDKTGLHASLQNPGPSFMARLLWLTLPACASILLLATTNKLCQEVAVIPFLWVLPLALYLLSFVITFDSPRWYARFPFALALGAALAALCWALANGQTAPLWLQLLIYCGGLFVCCMICHGELCRHKPEPARLTSFYLMIAAGGAAGSMLVALVAPLVFNDYYELHFGLLLCGLLFLISWLRDNPRMGRLDSDAPSSPLNPSAQVGSTQGHVAPIFQSGKWRQATAALGSAVLVALGLSLWFQARKGSQATVSQSRNFYGVLTVQEYGKGDPKSHEYQLLHGRTLHGMQFTEPLLSLRRTTYYSERGGAGLALRAFPAGNRRIGLVGLGIGTLTSYAQAGDYVRVYEIDPEVQRLAASRFTYLSDCLGRVETVLGDARLSLEAEPPQDFDILALDAFSSDAIPVHLLTREAFAAYGRHLKTNGVIAIHITNRMLDLEPVVLQLARQFGYRSAIIPHATTKTATLPSLWILLSRSAETISSPDIQRASRPPRPDWEKVPLWTDDFSSLFQILRPPAPPEVKPDPADEYYKLAAKLYEQRNHAGALAQYRLAIQSDPELPEALSNLAWLLATTPYDSLRNGGQAVQLAEKACVLTRYRVPAFVGALAASYAEAGRFDDAVLAVQKACDLAAKNGEQGLLSMNQQLMGLYRAHQPYHEAPR